MKQVDYHKKNLRKVEPPETPPIYKLYGSRGHEGMCHCEGYGFKAG